MIDNLKQIFKFLNDSSNVNDIRAVLDEVFPINAIYIYRCINIHENFAY